MRAFIAHSYHDSPESILDSIKRALADVGVQAFSFVESYPAFCDSRHMMRAAYQELVGSDFLIAEASNKPIGVGIEVGFAYANKIPIIYLCKDGLPVSTTVQGCSRFTIVYETTGDLELRLKETMIELTNNVS